MATPLQKKALDTLVEAGRNGSSQGKALIKAGYSPKTAIAPTKVTKSKGFLELCKQRGLTESFLVDALVEDIEEKPQDRKPELELGFKVLGKLKEQSDVHKTLILKISGEDAQRFKHIQAAQDTE